MTEKDILQHEEHGPEHDPDPGGGPGSDPGGSFFHALGSVARDVVLGNLGDFIGGPPGYFWSGALTALWIFAHFASIVGPPGIQGPVGQNLMTLGDRARVWVGGAGGTLYAGVMVATLTVWLGTKVWRATLMRKANGQGEPPTP